MTLKIDKHILALWLIILFIISIINTPKVPIGAGLHIDKVVHFILYGMTALMFLTVLRAKKGGKKPMLYAFLLSSIVGFIIEIIQSFTPHRRFEPADIMANTLGAAAFIIGWGVYNAIRRGGAQGIAQIKKQNGEK